MSIREGKSPLQARGYNLLAFKLMTIIPASRNGRGNWSMATFGWCYFVLMWNLIARRESVDALMLAHIRWEDDSLIIEEQGQII